MNGLRKLGSKATDIILPDPYDQKLVFFLLLFLFVEGQIVLLGHWQGFQPSTVISVFFGGDGWGGPKCRKSSDHLEAKVVFPFLKMDKCALEVQAASYHKTTCGSF